MIVAFLSHFIFNDSNFPFADIRISLVLSPSSRFKSSRPFDGKSEHATFCTRAISLSEKYVEPQYLGEFPQSPVQGT